MLTQYFIRSGKISGSGPACSITTWLCSFSLRSKITPSYSKLKGELARFFNPDPVAWRMNASIVGTARDICRVLYMPLHLLLTSFDFCQILDEYIFLLFDTNGERALDGRNLCGEFFNDAWCAYFEVTRMPFHAVSCRCCAPRVTSIRQPNTVPYPASFSKRKIHQTVSHSTSFHSLLISQDHKRLYQKSSSPTI